MRILSFYIIALLFCAGQVRAQDPIFTQYFLVPETLNPGFTGYLDTWHAGVLHRTQWPDGDRRIDTDYAFVNAAVGEMAGLGLTILNHREIFTNYNYLQVNATYSHRIPLNYDWSFRPGLEVGFGQKSFGFGNLLLEDQINLNDETISDGSVDPGVLGFKNKLNFFDVSAGFIVDREEAWFGAALKHLNRPDISFTESGNTPLEMLLSLHAGYEIGIYSTRFMFLPENTKLQFTSNYMMQGQYSRLDIGGAMIFDMFTFGATAATNPGKKTDQSHFLTSINPFGSIQLDHFIFGLSYDANTSKLGQTRGVYELSLTWQLDYAYRCWGCPNYLYKRKSGGRGGYNRR